MGERRGRKRWAGKEWFVRMTVVVVSMAGNEGVVSLPVVT